MSISAFSQETLNKRGFLELNDYASTIPGLSMLDVDIGRKVIYIRGLALTNSQRGTVGTYLGETPLSTVNIGTVDLKLVDIERLEVLKGPQGTLYGSNALAGTLRYIPVAPNLQEIEGSIKVDLATLDESDDLSQAYTGVFNIPLIEDQLALRVVGYHFEDAGWIDFTSTPEGENFGSAGGPIVNMDTIAAETGNSLKIEDDANSVTTTGFRASLLWQPNDQLDVTLMVGAQDQEAGSEQLTFLERGDFSMSNLDLGPNSQISDVDVASLVVGYDFGWAKLVSATSSLDTKKEEHRPWSSSSPTHSILKSTQVNGFLDSETFTQEFRLSSQLEGDFQFVAGVFYEDSERTSSPIWSWIGDPDVMPDSLGGDPIVVTNIRTIDYQQQAFFGELSYQFNEYIELTVGGRHFDYDREDSGIQGDAPLDGKVIPVDSGEKGDIFKANISYTPNDDTLLYAQVSEGFRLGRGQAVPKSSECDVDNDGFLDHTGGRLTPDIEADTTENVELGAKFTLLDNRLALNTAIYQVDWSGLPFRFAPTTTDCSSNITNNVGEVRSEGVEVELSYLITEAFKLDFAFAYNESEFTDVLETSTLEVGETLPFAPKVTANLGLEYSFDLNKYPAFVRTDINHFGEVNVINQDLMDRLDLPTAGGQTQVGLRAGVTIDQWELSLYGQNLTNEDNVTWLRSFGTRAAGQLRPRKIGFQVNYSF